MGVWEIHAREVEEVPTLPERLRLIGVFGVGGLGAGEVDEPALDAELFDDLFGVLLGCRKLAV